MAMQTLGGLGIFLVGMITLTDGLHAIAGEAMRKVLVRFTSSPVTGAMTGATTTAILQSSSATTVTAVGFVGAGLLNFSEALGIIFGANIGTTITGWLVVLIGFKLKLATLVLPLVLVGALLKLFSKKRIAMAGLALAGFGLIFVGISMMQQGMAGVESLISPEQFPPDTWLGRAQLLLFGIVFTLITQSSSAGVAIALTTLNAGAINFNQAAVLVIGMDVGTTVTAALATIGGSIGSRRTGFSHVFYNVITAMVALLLLTPFIYTYDYFFPTSLSNNAEIALVAFHTFFNGVGVILILPFTKLFALFICRVIRSDKPSYIERLDPGLLKEPAIAIDAITSSIKLQLVETLEYIQSLLQRKDPEYERDFVELQIYLDDTHAYVDLIHLESKSDAAWQRLLMCIHVLDHMQRLHERCAEPEQHINMISQFEELEAIANQLSLLLISIKTKVEHEQWRSVYKAAKTGRINLKKQLVPIRNRVMTQIAQGTLTVPQANDAMEAMRWLQRIFNHIARVAYHFRSIEIEKADF